MTENRRISDRIAYGCPARFMALGRKNEPKDRVWTEGEVLNLSPGGIGIRAQGMTLHAGAVLQAWMPVADTKVSLPVLAQVKWIRPDSPGQCVAGLQFLT